MGRFVAAKLSGSRPCRKAGIKRAFTAIDQIVRVELSLPSSFRTDPEPWN